MEGVSKLTGYVPSGSTGWGAVPFPDWRGGFSADWRHEKAVFAVDFLRSDTSCGVGRDFDVNCVSDERASVHHLIDETGALRIFGVNALARTSGRGAYFGSAFTNSIRNPRGEGAVTGVLGSGGALPTNWSVSAGGLAIEIVSRGSVPLPFVELHFSGVATATMASLYFEANSHALAIAGESWGMDLWAHYPVEPLAAANQVSLDLQSYGSGGSLQNALPKNVSLDGHLERHELKRVLSNSSTYAARPALVFALTIGATYDFVMRVAAPKLCKLVTLEGPELVTNGTFSTDATGWTTESATLVSASGAGRLSALSVNPNAYQTITTVGGAVYKAQAICNVVTNSGTSIPRLFMGSLSNVLTGAIFGGASTGAVTLSGYAVAGSTSTNLYIGAGGSQSGSGVFDWDNVSFRQVFAGFMPDYPILPPEGDPKNMLRAADHVEAIQYAGEPFEGWSTGGLEDGFSVLVEIASDIRETSLDREILSIGSDSGNACHVGMNASGDLRARSVCDGSPLWEVLTSGVWPDIETLRLAVNFAATGIVLIGSGLDAVEIETEGDIPAATVMKIGAAIDGSHHLNGFIRKLQICRLMSESEAMSWVG